jgi:hypothetical protein
MVAGRFQTRCRSTIADGTEREWKAEGSQGADVVNMRKDPNTKIQDPEKHQAPTSRGAGVAGKCELEKSREVLAKSSELSCRLFGAWILVFLWSLDLGVWSFSAHAQSAAPIPQDPLISLMQAQPRIEINGPVNPSAAFDPPAVRPGEKAIYRVSFNALEESIEMPKEITASKELSLQAGAHGQILQLLGPVMVPFTTFNYRVRASTNGEFNVPEFVVQVYGKPVKVPAARLEVSSTPAATAMTPQHLYLEIPATNTFIGQPVPARILLPGLANGSFQSLGQVQLSGQGFVVDQGAAHQRIESMPRAGANVATYFYETMLTPIQGGKLSIFAQGFTSGSRFGGNIVINGSIMVPGGQQQYVLLESDPVELSTRPLPREGELAGFTGAIGKFTVDPPVLATNTLRVGDPVRLTVAIHGGPNLGRLVAPQPPRVRDWQVFETTTNNAPPQVAVAQGLITFSYTLIPLTEESRATPPIPFSFFDPEREAYVDLTIPSVPVQIKPGAAPADLGALLKTGPGAAEDEKDLTLSGLAASPGRSAHSLVPLQRNSWFPLLQLLPAAVFLGLWIWDRRRRYFEQHPEVLVRRRARRALHREWRALRQAARSGDAQGFASAAVSAMRVGCAPHYPAEPRALVGSDVLQLLQERPNPVPISSYPRIPSPTKSIGHVETPKFDLHRVSDAVRRFFTITDATRFTASKSDPTELLALQPELDQVLQQLEARL